MPNWPSNPRKDACIVLGSHCHMNMSCFIMSQMTNVQIQVNSIGNSHCFVKMEDCYDFVNLLGGNEIMKALD